MQLAPVPPTGTTPRLRPNHASNLIPRAQQTHFRRCPAFVDFPDAGNGTTWPQNYKEPNECKTVGLPSSRLSKKRATKLPWIETEMDMPECLCGNNACNSRVFVFALMSGLTQLVPKCLCGDCPNSCGCIRLDRIAQACLRLLRAIAQRRIVHCSRFCYCPSNDKVPTQLMLSTIDKAVWLLNPPNRR